MKTLKILETVSIPGARGFTAGEVVKVLDFLADILLSRGFAEEFKATEPVEQGDTKKEKHAKIAAKVKA